MEKTAPLPHQGRAGLQRSAGVGRTSAFLELSRQSLQRRCKAGVKASIWARCCSFSASPLDDQIATEAQRRADVMQSPPRNPQVCLD